MNPTSTHPKVSVCVVTYNQRDYIGQCLQSLIDQETNFSFEIIVCDDCSTDGTSEIISEFTERHPLKVKNIRHSKNVGAYKNFVFSHQQATGEYIAHMDGDDFALPRKLETQTKFLDANPNCNITWHRMLIRNESKNITKEDLVNVDTLPTGGFNRSDILRFPAIGVNSSKMYRRIVREFDTPDFPVMDYFANAEHVGTGVAHFIGKEPLGVYRVGLGIASKGITTKLLLAKSLAYFQEKYPEENRAISTGALFLLLIEIKNLRTKTAMNYAKIYLKQPNIISFFDLIKYWKTLRQFRMPKF